MRRLALTCALIVAYFALGALFLDPPAPIQCPWNAYFEGVPCQT